MERLNLPVQRNQLTDVLFEGVILVHRGPLGGLLGAHDLGHEGNPDTHLTVRPVGQVIWQPADVLIWVVFRLNKSLKHSLNIYLYCII